MKTLIACLGLVCLSVHCSVAMATPVVDAGLEQAPESDLRLRLADEKQERRTTSLNWVDLNAARILAPLATPLLPEEEDRSIKILIDPGHGGEDRGAVGHDGLLEKEVALRLARFVRQEIVSQARRLGEGVKVRLTRDDDRFVPLHERPEIANNWEADLFVSIHLNSAPSAKVRGFEVYFLNPKSSDAEASRVARAENGGDRAPAKSAVLSILSDVQTNVHIAESSRFAEEIYAALSQEILPNKRGVRQAPFAVLTGTEMPALLVEVGYLTHPSETLNLKRGVYLKRVASAISSGILRFAQGRKKPQAPHASRRQATR